MSQENILNIQEFFKEIVSRLNNYEFRPQQIIMADKISQSFNAQESLIIEAGTGSGKSFGYLVPAIHSEAKIVISTGTIALQEQLLNKDIPFVVNNSGKEVSVALAKGRGNYVCHQRFFETLKSISTKTKEAKIISQIEDVIYSEWEGDIADLEFIVPPLVWQEINSDKDDCLNSRCSYFSQCAFRAARSKLVNADLIISNHALYFTDLAAGGTIFPKHDYVIFDEAHHIKDSATRAITVRIGRQASTKLMQKIQKRIGPIPDYISSSIIGIETEIISWLFSKDKNSFRLYPDPYFYELVSREIAAISHLRSWLNSIEIDQMDLFSDTDKFKKINHKDLLLSQTNNLISKWKFFLEQELVEEDDLRVNWAETSKIKTSFEIFSAPIFVAKFLEEYLWSKIPSVLTSATLAVNKNCQYAKKQLGINGKDLLLDSPFDYTKQSCLYLPTIQTDPNAKDYNAEVSKQIIDIVKASRGRALVLFTSIYAMNNVSAYVMEHINYPGKIQGDLPRNKLIKWFIETDNSILFATSTFWEGIDIPGEDLSCVIIDKIPFTNPDDPVVSATVDLMKSKNQSWFMDYMLPDATLRLKQGFGRLIRTKNDVGMIAILDPRLTTKAYGKVIINSLPKTKIIKSIEEVKSFFESLQNIPAGIQ